MDRTCLGMLAGAVVLLAWHTRPLEANDHPDRKQQAVLSVQVALDQGQQCLQRGDYVGAVTILEKQLAYIDGNRRYLNALREAYRGLVIQLEKAGKTADAKRYRGFLEILEPAGSSLRTPEPRSEPMTVPLQEPVVAAPRQLEGGIIPRGKVEVDDPFADSNRAPSSPSNLLQRADLAFQAKNYAEAARLYSQVSRLDANLIGASQSKWNYCQLYCIAQRLNQGEVSEREQLQSQILRVIQSTPQLQKFGQSLLDRLASMEEPSTSVASRHTPRQGNGWAVVENNNFRIYHMLSEAEAEKILQIAEHTRVRMTRKWFGEDPQDWSPRCDIIVHPNGESYARSTGAPASAPGHSTISREAGRILSRRIDVRGDDPNFTIGVLPHETTHVVLAGRFGHHDVPRWADEGIAVLSEPRERIELHLRNLSNFRRDNTLFTVQELMRQEDYPEPQRIGPFYAQSTSVVEFLCQKRDPQSFIRFLRMGLEGRYETALKSIYGYNSFADLDRDWHAHAFGSEATVARTSQKRMPYAGAR